jgi:hypothetical protein
MDDSWVVKWIQALVDAKIANKRVINTHAHSDFVPNTKYVGHHEIT